MTNFNCMRQFYETDSLIFYKYSLNTTHSCHLLIMFCCSINSREFIDRTHTVSNNTGNIAGIKVR